MRVMFGNFAKIGRAADSRAIFFVFKELPALLFVFGKSLVVLLYN